MKKIDMKLSKKTSKEMGASVEIGQGDEYPYGLRISLNNEQLDKIEGLEGAEVGGECEIIARGVITSKREHEMQGGKKDCGMEIQIKSLGIEYDKPEDKMDDDEYYKRKGRKNRRG